MYSPAARPSRTRAAPAKKPDLVDHRRDLLRARSAASGLPVFSTSRATSSSACASTRRRSCSSAGCRSRGRRVAPRLERRGRGRGRRGRRPSAPETGAVRERPRRWSGRPGRWCGPRGVDGLAVDEVAQGAAHWISRRSSLERRTRSARRRRWRRCGASLARDSDPDSASVTIATDVIHRATIRRFATADDGFACRWRVLRRWRRCSVAATRAGRHSTTLSQGDHRAAAAGRPPRRTPRSARPSGCPRPRCASASSGSSTPASCRSSP